MVESFRCLKTGDLSRKESPVRANTQHFVSRRFFLLGVMGLSACTVGAPRSTPRTPEEELALRSRDLQRSMLQAAAAGFLGAGGIYVLGGPRGGGVGVAVIGAIPIAIGSYVGYLAQQYDTNEERRAKLRADAALTRAEAEAALRTAQAVVSRQQARVAAVSESASQIAETRTFGLKARADIRAGAMGLIDRLAELDAGRKRFGTDSALDAVMIQTAELQKEFAATAEAVPLPGST